MYDLILGYLKRKPLGNEATEKSVIEIIVNLAQPYLLKKRHPSIQEELLLEMYKTVRDHVSFLNINDASMMSLLFIRRPVRVDLWRASALYPLEGAIARLSTHAGSICCVHGKGELESHDEDYSLDLDEDVQDLIAQYPQKSDAVFYERLSLEQRSFFDSFYRRGLAERFFKIAQDPLFEDEDFIRLFNSLIRRDSRWASKGFFESWDIIRTLYKSSFQGETIFSLIEDDILIIPEDITDIYHYFRGDEKALDLWYALSSPLVLNLMRRIAEVEEDAYLKSQVEKHGEPMLPIRSSFSSADLLKWSSETGTHHLTSCFEVIKVFIVDLWGAFYASESPYPKEKDDAIRKSLEAMLVSQPEEECRKVIDALLYYFSRDYREPIDEVVPNLYFHGNGVNGYFENPMILDEERLTMLMQSKCTLPPYY